MKLRELLSENLKIISLQAAKDKNFFGPVYHGSSSAGRENIEKHGFKVIKGKDEGAVHGYNISNYSSGKPAPVHHLGYGVYFTTVKAIAKKFNLDTGRGLIEYYLDVPRIQQINFASPNTMMKWWIENGYDFDWKNIQGDQNFSNPNVEKERLRATERLTQTLKSKYDAVWFKGKTLYTALDGDQICVYEPEDRIFKIDPKLSKGMEIGAQVKIAAGATEAYLKSYEERFAKEITTKQEGNVIVFYNQNGSQFHRQPLGVKGTIMDIRNAPNGKKYYSIKWTKGGTQFNYVESELEFLS